MEGIASGDLRTLQRLAAVALFKGGRKIGAITVEWDVHGSCTNPQWTERYVRPSARPRRFTSGKLEEFQRAVRAAFPGARVSYTNQAGLGGTPRTVDVFPGSAMPMRLIMCVRCRTKCQPCLKDRAREWMARARLEHKRASRSWMGTLTYAPSVRAIKSAEAVLLAANAGVDWDTLNDHEKFAYKVRACSKDLTDFLKRIRKGVPSDHTPHLAAEKARREPKDGWRPLRFRYLAVWEPHKHGWPHVHLLYHESRNDPLSWLLLSSQWWWW